MTFNILIFFLYIIYSCTNGWLGFAYTLLLRRTCLFMIPRWTWQLTKGVQHACNKRHFFLSQFFHAIRYHSLFHDIIRETKTSLSHSPSRHAKPASNTALTKGYKIVPSSSNRHIQLLIYVIHINPIFGASVAEPPNLMPPRSTYLLLDTKYSRENTKLSVPSGTP